MNSYRLTKAFFAFCCETPSLTTNHIALYLWLVECNNQQQWQEIFAFTFEEAGAVLHISYKTFKKTLDDLIKWEFIQLIHKPVNRFSTAWKLSLGKTPTLNGSEAEIPTQHQDSEGNFPEQPNCSVGNSEEEIPTQSGCSDGNSPTLIEYINYKTLFPNIKNEKGAHEEENLKNPVSPFSEPIEVPEEEKKKSSAQKRKEFPLREAEFKTAVLAFAGIYEIPYLRAFYEYWSEPDPQGNMRFELERTWELNRRIGQWMRRENQFSKPQKPQSNEYHTEENLDYSIPL